MSTIETLFEALVEIKSEYASVVSCRDLILLLAIESSNANFSATAVGNYVSMDRVLHSEQVPGIASRPNHINKKRV